LSLQLLPDTAETEWLDRHGNIWLVNADGTKGRKLATVASGTANFVSAAGSILVPSGTVLFYAGTSINYQTTADILTDAAGAPTPAPIIGLNAGSAGNLLTGVTLAMQGTLAGIQSVTVGTLSGGTDDETDDELRARVLQRIREPPMGGDQTDYEAWALAIPGVTRAWCAPLEMGIGTVTLRFMMDDLRADNDGFPLGQDVLMVQSQLDKVRPVAVKDFFVVAPIKQPIDVYINNLTTDSAATRAAIEASLRDMLFTNAAPGQTIFAAWKSYAIMNAAGVVSFDMNIFTDDIMPSPGHMAVLGSIIYDSPAIPAP
jgi:uncharacterized phage protein gp47/JayE